MGMGCVVLRESLATDPPCEQLRTRYESLELVPSSTAQVMAAAGLLQVSPGTGGDPEPPAGERGPGRTPVGDGEASEPRPSERFYANRAVPHKRS